MFMLGLRCIIHMNLKHIPKRSCVSCKGKFSKGDLLRLVYDKHSEEVSLDIKQRFQSRGAYICSDEKCYNKMFKKGVLLRFLGSNNLSSEIISHIVKERT